MFPKNTRLCFIVNQYRDPVLVIATLIFDGERDKDVKKKLDKALATLPFRTLYSYVISTCGLTFLELFKKVRIKEVVDYPGAKIVKISLEVQCESAYFLPRNPRTKKFVDIDKQVKCLEALKVVPRYKTYPAAD